MFPLVPEWYLLIAGIVALGSLGALWAPLLVGLPVAGAAVGATVVQAVRGAARTDVPEARARGRWKLRGLTAVLYLIQPAARLWGRVSFGLTPWRRRARHPAALPRPRTFLVWSERWQAHDQRLRAVEGILHEQGVPVRRGGVYDDWDLEVRGGLMACVRTRLGVEEYPRGRQYLRFRAWPCLGRAAYAAVVPGGLAAGAAFQHASAAALALAALAAVLALRALGDYAAALGCVRTAVEQYGQRIASATAGDSPGQEARSDVTDSAAGSNECKPHERHPIPPAGRRGELGGARDYPGLAAAIARLDILEHDVRRCRPESCGNADRPPGSGVLDSAVDAMDRPPTASATAAAGDLS